MFHGSWGPFPFPYILSFTAHLGNVSCCPSHAFRFLGTRHSSIPVQQMWLLSQDTGLSSPHSSRCCGVSHGVCSPPRCRTKPSSPGCVVSFCAQGVSQPHLGFAELYSSWIKPLPSPLQVLLLPSLWQPSCAADCCLEGDLSCTALLRSLSLSWLCAGLWLELLGSTSSGRIIGKQGGSEPAAALEGTQLISMSSCAQAQTPKPLL